MSNLMTHLTLTISKVNETYIKVLAEPHIQHELSEFFTFQVPGYRFMPAYRAKRWDGKLRLYSKATGKLYGGLLSYVYAFAENNFYTIECDDDARPHTKIEKKNVDDFCKSLKPKSQSKDIEIRDYQLQSVYQILKRHKLLLLSPTASGKSLIIYCLIRFFTLKDYRILLIVPTTSLVEQMYTDFKDYGWNVEKYCHRKYYGYASETDKSVVISTWQSLATFDKSFFEDFKVVIGDEAHLYKSKELQKIMSSLINAKYRIGTTGTLDDSKTHKLILEGLFGPVYKATTTKILIDKKQLSDFKINCLVLKHNESDRKTIRNATYQEEMDYIVTHEKRNKFIHNLCKSLNGNTLCLFQYVEKHGKKLYDIMKEFDRKVFFVHGGIETKDRETIRSITENEKNAIIVASFGTFSTGINIRNLHNIIFASPSKSRIRNLQSIGRGLRLGDNKKAAVLYDISDDLCIGVYKNYTLNHFAERINSYTEEEFEYEIHNIDL